MEQIKAAAICLVLCIVLALVISANSADAQRAKGERSILNVAALAVLSDTLSLPVWQVLALSGWIGGAFCYGQLIYCRERLKEVDNVHAR